VALFLAIATGGAMGVSLLGSKNIKNNSLTGRDIRDGSLSRRDMGAIPGPEVVVRAGPEGTLDCAAPGCVGRTQVNAMAAACLEDEVAVGGGVAMSASESALTASRPVYDPSSDRKRPTGWTGSGVVDLGVDPQGSVPLPHAWALCAPR
jgi:hypothetical protein